MELTADTNEVEVQTVRKVGGGIKNFTFTSTGTNGTSHRKNADRKKRQYLKNQDARRALYQERSRMAPSEWHSRLNAISLGTV